MIGSINKGDKVYWDWGQSRVSGKVVDTYMRTAVKKLNELKSIQKVNTAAKALLIELTDGRRVLKLENEVKLER